MDRISHGDKALRLLLTLLGDHRIASVRIVDKSPEAEQILQTTWLDLTEAGLVTRHGRIGGTKYSLTPRGWLRALEIVGELDSANFQTRFGKLTAFLKDLVKGRREDALTQVSEVASKIQESEAWVANMLASEVWRVRGQYGADLHEMGQDIDVPLNFGMERI